MSFQKVMLVCRVAVLMTVFPGLAAASGFALIEQSGSGLGNAYAGGAASAEDASTVFFNPAGMSRLQGRQVVVALHAIKPSVKFSDTGSAAASLQTKGGAGGDAGDLALIPSGYFAMEINPQMRFGLGVNVPFGLKTEYDGTWMGRFQAIKSKIETINLNPSLSYQLNDSVSVGAGISYQRIKGELTSAVNYSAAAFAAGGAGLLAAIGGAGVEGATTVSGDDASWGYNLGMLYKLSPQTRIGVAYRSSIKHNLSGAVTFTSVPALLSGSALLANGPVSLAIKMPDTFSTSLFHQFNDKWDIMADATWTGWSKFQQLNVVRSNGATLLSVQEDWRSTWRVSLGANHHYNEKSMARIGVAYDQTPVSDAHRTARIPDGDRTWLALGWQHKPSNKSAIDFGYAHLFVKDTTIADRQAAAGKGDLIGNYKNHVDILSIQYTHSF